MKQNNPIGIFDSGIGGVTVFKEILKILPNENFIYYSDSKNNPYGDKSDSEILDICDNIVNFLINKNCKAIVIACNTASAKAASFLRTKYPDIPIIAIEPAYKMVHDYAFEDPTLIMATRGTIESEKFNLLYQKYDNHNTCILPCIGLADRIENGDAFEIKKHLNSILEPYIGKVKNVVLGCTHYPLATSYIKEFLGDVKFFDGAPFVVKHLKNVLESKSLLGNNDGNITFIDTSNSVDKEKRFFEILNAKKRQ